MTAIFRSYMVGPYNECFKRNWVDPSLITNEEFARIFRGACDHHQGKGEHERYAKKVMKRFAQEDINGKTITPLHQGLSSLMTHRIQVRNQGIQVHAQNEAEKAAKQREDEINNLRMCIENVQNALNHHTQQRAALQAEMNERENRLRAAQNATAQLVERVNALAQLIQNAQRDGQNLNKLVMQLEQQYIQEARVLTELQASRADRNILQARLLAEVEAKNVSEARVITELRGILVHRDVSQAFVTTEVPVQRNTTQAKIMPELRAAHAQRNASQAQVIAQMQASQLHRNARLG